MALSRQPSPTPPPAPPPVPSPPCRLERAISRQLSRDGPLKAALACAASCTASRAVSHVRCPRAASRVHGNYIILLCNVTIVEYYSKNIYHTYQKQKKEIKKQDRTCKNEKTLTYPYGYRFRGYGSGLDLANPCQTCVPPY